MLLAGAADALLGGRPLDADARALLGLALRRWLEEGGDLERHLGVRAPRGSHRTPAALRRRLVVRPSEADPPAVTELRRYLLDHREEGSGSTAGVLCTDELQDAGARNYGRPDGDD